MSDVLTSAAIADPRLVRMVFSYVENGVCVTEVVDCFNIAAMSFEVNGDTTEIICTNRLTGMNEVVGVIDGGATQKLTFDIERLLPRESLSLFFELIRKNCGLSITIIRSDICTDPFDPNDFDVADILGVVRFGNYSRSAMLFRNYADAAAITESTTVTAYGWIQFSGEHHIATRGSLHTAPIVDVTLCDRKICGGLCQDDSDGCQKWFTLGSDGVVGYTDDQFTTEGILPVIPSLNFTAPAVTIQCGPRGQLIVTDSAGNMFIADIEEILTEGTATWTELLLDSDGNDIPQLFDSYYTASEPYVWYVGAGGTLYQYYVSSNTLVAVPTVPGVVNDYLTIDKKNKYILIGGVAATLLISYDGARSFTLVDIIDPATDLALDAGIDIQAVEILSKTVWSIGLSDDRVLYTLDGGDTWNSQLIFGAGGGEITDIEYYTSAQGSQIGWMTRNDDTGMGHLYTTIYGVCEEWIEVPESPNETIPDNEGLTRVVFCPDNPNVAVAVGTSVGGAGVVFVTTAEYE